MKTAPFSRHDNRGFTLIEILISMSIGIAAVGMALGAFLTGLRIMSKDVQRLATNASLRYITAQVAKETIDASEFYLFPTYQSLDGSVNPATDVSAADSINTTDYYGDCLVLVTKVSDSSSSSNIRQFKIYYRVVTNPNQDGPLRYYESPDYGATTGTSTPLATLLNAINLSTTPQYPGSRVLAKTAHGHVRPSSSNNYPIFSSNAATITPTVQSVSINVEIVSGIASNNLLSSSCFNYTISPRR